LSKGKHILFSTGRGSVSISPDGLTTGSAPDRFLENGLCHVGSYISRLMTPSTDFKSLLIFTIDGERGFSLWARDGALEAFFTLHLYQGPDKERAIRDFFASLSNAPKRDFLAKNGPALETVTRYLVYSLAGAHQQITALAIHLLTEIYGVSPKDALEFTLTSKI
jgi:hypothetical protein